MIKLYNFDELRPEEILNRDIRAEKNVEDVVDGIIADVRARGDDALKDYALKFDGAKIDALQVTQEEIDEAFAGMDPYFLETLREAAANIESFQRGIGYSMTPTVLTIFGTCLLRLVWIFTVVPLSKSYETLLAVYPISWVITGISVCTAYAIIRRKAFSLSVLQQQK